MRRRQAAAMLVLLAALALGGCEGSDSADRMSDDLQEELSGGAGEETVVLSGEADRETEVSASSEESTESVKKVSGETENNLTPGRDGETVKAYLADFSNDLADYESAEDCYVILHGEIAYGQENWDHFVTSVEQGTPAYVVLVQFTVEGDAILQYLEYDGADFYRFSDYSRDAFGGTGNRYFEEEYAYLKSLPCHDIKGNEYSYIFLTNSDAITMTQIEYYQYVGIYTDCADAAPDLFFLFQVMVKERDQNAPVAQPEEVFEEEVNLREDVAMEILYNTPVSIGVEIKNDSDAEVTYGEAYDLQVLKDGKWYRLSYVIDNAAFHSLGYMLPGGNSQIWGTDWTVFHGVLGEGKYRLVKTVRVEENGDYQNYYLAAEFEIDLEDGAW